MGAEPETWGRDLPVTGPSAVPQGCPGEPCAAVQAAWWEEKPESPVEPEVTQGPLPASCQVSTISPSVFTGSCACRAAGGENVTQADEPQTLFLWFVSVWAGRRERHRLAFLEVSCRLGSSLQSSLVSPGEMKCVAWQPERAWCECTAEEGKRLLGPELQVVGLWLLGPVTLIFP